MGRKLNLFFLSDDVILVLPDVATEANGTIKTQNFRACLFSVFKNCFLFLKTKNTKNSFG